MLGLANKRTNITRTYDILFQIIFMYTFLTSFFFLFVVFVEKFELSNQINFLVDQLLTDQKLNKLFHGQQQYMIPLVLGILEAMEIKSAGQTENTTIKNKNKKIELTAFTIVGTSLGFLLFSIILLLLAGYNLPIKKQTREALWIMFFIAITEFIFLEVVAKNYISINTNFIIKQTGESIVKWLNNHKKV